MSKELLEVFDTMDDVVTDELRDLFSHRSPSPTEIRNAKEAVCLLKEAHELKVSIMMEEITLMITIAEIIVIVAIAAI